MTITTEAEFTAMYRAHFSDVRRFVSRRTDPAGADDVVGETFLIAWRRRRELPADPRPWLFRTARNVLLNASRGQRRGDALAVRIAEHASQRGPGQPADQEALLDLVIAWRRLSAADQEALSLHAWEGLTDTDAAAVLGCDRAAYSMRLSRARKRLAGLLDPADTSACARVIPAVPIEGLSRSPAPGTTYPAAPAVGPARPAAPAQ